MVVREGGSGESPDENVGDTLISSTANLNSFHIWQAVTGNPLSRPKPVFLKPTQMSIDQYIIDSAPYFTLGEMAETLEMHPATLARKCERLGVKPVKIQERQKAYILAHKHWSRERLSKALGIGDRMIRDLCVELDLDIPLTESEVRKSKPIAQRLRETWL